MGSPRPPRRAGWCLTFAAVAMWASHASAQQQTVARLSVARSGDASDCPSAEALADRVNTLTWQQAILPSSRTQSRPPRLKLEVDIHSGQAGHEAVIRASGSRSGERRISDIGLSCEGLSEALTLTLALIVDDELAGRHSRRPPVVFPLRMHRASPSAPPVERPWDLALTFALGASAGILDRTALVLRGGAELDLGAPSVGIGVLSLPAQTIPAPPGEVDVSILAGYFQTCTRIVDGLPSVALSACSAFAAGTLRGRGRGYATNRDATRPWLVLGGSTRASGPLNGRVVWTLETSFFAPIREERFVVDGIGRVYDPAPAGVLVAAGISMSVF